MAVINRISRLLRADFHAVLDQVEDPELMLRQAIREMQDDVIDREQRLRSASNELAELQARKHQLAKTLKDVEEQIDLCFASDKPALARNFIRRRLETERHAGYLARREAAVDEHLGEQRATLEQHRMTLDGLKQKAEIFSGGSRGSSANAQAEEPYGHYQAVSDDEVEVAFLREQSKRGTA